MFLEVLCKSESVRWRQKDFGVTSLWFLTLRDKADILLCGHRAAGDTIEDLWNWNSWNPNSKRSVSYKRPLVFMRKDRVSCRGRMGWNGKVLHPADSWHVTNVKEHRFRILTWSKRLRRERARHGLLRLTVNSTGYCHRNYIYNSWQTLLSRATRNAAQYSWSKT